MDKKNKSKFRLVLVGPTGTGKTQGMITLLEETEYKIKTLKINDINNLSELTPDHSAWRMDDLNW